MKRPKRVLHVLNSLDVGGLEVWVLNLLRHADRREFEMDVLCRGTSVGVLADRAVASGARVHHLRQHAWSRHIGYPSRVARLLRDGQYDVLHCHLGVLSLPFLIAARGAGVSRRIVTHHSPVHPVGLYRYEWLSYVPGFMAGFASWQESQNRLIAEMATDVTLCAAHVVDAIYPVRPKNIRISVLTPALELGNFEVSAEARDAARRELGLGEEDVAVIHVGRLVYPKNQLTIVRAAAEARRSKSRLKWIIVGEGPLRKALTREIAKFGLEDHVRLYGHSGDVPCLLGAADIAVHPSITEGLPVAVLEYQAARLPVVASSIPAHREALPPGSRTVNPSSAEELSRAVLEISESAPLRRSLGEAGRRWILERYSIDKNTRDLESIYSNPDASLDREAPAGRGPRQVPAERESAAKEPRPTFIVSFDCEGKWGMADTLAGHEHAVSRVYQRLSDLLARYEVKATFAFVGAMTMSEDEVRAKMSHFTDVGESRRVRLAKFLDDVRARRVEGWLAPEAVGTVLSSGLHELASHGFTHTPLVESEIPVAEFDGEMNSVCETDAFRSSKDMTLVYPNNRVGFSRELKRFGIIGYRGSLATVQNAHPPRWRHVLDEIHPFPGSQSHAVESDGVIEIPPGRFLNWRSGGRAAIPRAWTAASWRRSIWDSVKTRGISHLWSHPENFATGTEMFELFEEVLKGVSPFIRSGDIWNPTMREYAQTLRSGR